MFSAFIEFIAPRPSADVEFEHFLRSGQIDRAADLLKKNNDLPVCNLDSSGLCPMHYACLHGHLELCMELLLRGSDVSQQSASCGSTPLHFAAANNHYGVVEILLRSAADPSVPNDNGNIPVELCTEQRVREVLLRPRGDSMLFGPKDTIPMSERTVEVEPGNSSEAQPVILLHSVDSTPTAREYTSTEVSRADALMRGVQEAAIATAQAYRYSPAETDIVRSIFAAVSRPVHLSSKLPEVIRLCKVDPNYLNVRAAAMANYAIDGFTPLHAAAFTGNIPFIIFFLEGIKVSHEQHSQVQKVVASHRSSGGGMMSPKELYTATHSRNTKAISGLLKGFSFNSEPAVDAGCPKERAGSINLEGMDELLDADLTPECTEKNHSEDNYLVVRADPWAVDLQGKTALHHAVAQRKVEACRILREAMKQTGPRLRRADWNERRPSYSSSYIASPKTPQRPMVQFSELSGMDPVGLNAPVDLTGTTPLGFLPGKYSQGIKADLSELEKELFSPGDASIMPQTPHFHRSGALRAVSTAKRILPSAALQTESELQNRYCGASLSLTPASQSAAVENDVVANNPSIKLELTPGDNDTGAVEFDIPSQASLVYAYSEAGGWRYSMEDRVVICAPLIPTESVGVLMEAFISRDNLIPELDMTQWSLFAVLDGHNGDFSSSFVSDILPSLLIRNAADLIKSFMAGKSLAGDVFAVRADDFFNELWTRTMLQADKILSQQSRMEVTTTADGKINLIDNSGTTCVACLITPSYIAVANVGDSRAVLGLRKSGEGANAVAMSVDHKPHLPFEKERIEKTGCSATPVSEGSTVLEVTTKINKHRLRMSRSLGDFYLKNSCNDIGELLDPRDQAISALPDVYVHKRSERDFCMLLACDGIWDVYENDAAINFVFQMAGKIDESAVNNGMRSSVAETCDELLLSCLKKGSRDNMTAILLLLNAVTYSNENVTPEAKSVGLAESPGPLDIETALRPEVGDDTSTVGADSSSPLSEIPTRRKLFEQI